MYFSAWHSLKGWVDIWSSLNPFWSLDCFFQYNIVLRLDHVVHLRIWVAWCLGLNLWAVGISITGGNWGGEYHCVMLRRMRRVFRAVLNLFALPGSPRSWCRVLSQASVCGSNVIVFAHVYHELTRHLKISKSFTHIILVILTTTQWSKYYYHPHIVDEGIEAWRGKCFAQGYSTWKWWILHLNPGSLTFNNYHKDQSNCF